MVKKSKNLHYFEATGRRKEAVVRVRLHIVGKDKTATVGGVKFKAGEILYNKKPISQFFSIPSQKVRYLNPLKLTDSEDRFVITMIGRSGGLEGQLDAVVLGISRALEKVDKETYRPILKKAGLFTRDSRVRQRRMVGTGGKARRAKQSPKR